MLSPWTKKSRYERLQEHDDASEATEKNQLPSHTNFQNAWLWILAFLSGVFSTVLVLLSVFGLHVYGSYEDGFPTEIDRLRSVVDVVPVKFTGTLRYKDGEHLYIDLGPNGVQYFGSPSNLIDDAWQELLIGLNDDTYPGNVIGVDVLHSLHCLNEVRKVLDSNYYYNTTLESLNRGKRIHIDHCLNHIRQVIQCHMDLTPIRTVYFPDINVEVGDFDQVHMCRDFSKLQERMKRRGAFNSAETQKQKSADGQGHRLGYPNNEESMALWGELGREFD